MTFRAIFRAGKFLDRLGNPSKIAIPAKVIFRDRCYAREIPCHAQPLFAPRPRPGALLAFRYTMSNIKAASEPAAASKYRNIIRNGKKMFLYEAVLTLVTKDVFPAKAGIQGCRALPREIPTIAP